MKTLTRRLLMSLVLFFCVQSILLADVTDVDNQQLEKLIAAGVAVIDVRRPDEWKATGVIEGAHKLTFFDKQGRYDAGKWLSDLNKIASKDAPVVLICARGVRSKTIAKLLDKQVGYTNMHNHTLGMVDWVSKGKPVVKHE